MRDTVPAADATRWLRHAAQAWRRDHPERNAEQVARDLGTTEGLLIASCAGIHPGDPGDWRVVRLQPLSAGALATGLGQAPGAFRWLSGGLTLHTDACWQDGPQPGTWTDPGRHLQWQWADEPGLQHFACRQRFGREGGWRLVAVDAQGGLRWQWRLGPLADPDRFGQFLARWGSARLGAGLDPAPLADPGPDPGDPAPVREAWLRTRCADEAGGLQQRWGLDRWSLLGLAEPRFVHPLDPAVLPELLDRLAEERLWLQAEMPQGAQRLSWQGRLQPRHPGAGLDGCRLGSATWSAPALPGLSAWMVRQPTRQGCVLRLELFDAEHRWLLRLGPSRTPGTACAWEHLLTSQADPGAPFC